MERVCKALEGNARLPHFFSCKVIQEHSAKLEHLLEHHNAKLNQVEDKREKEDIGCTPTSKMAMFLALNYFGRQKIQPGFSLDLFVKILCRVFDPVMPGLLAGFCEGDKGLKRLNLQCRFLRRCPSIWDGSATEALSPRKVSRN